MQNTTPNAPVTLKTVLSFESWDQAIEAEVRIHLNWIPGIKLIRARGLTFVRVPLEYATYSQYTLQKHKLL